MELIGRYVESWILEMKKPAEVKEKNISIRRFS
jgi:hypothetical protein